VGRAAHADIERLDRTLIVLHEVPTGAMRGIPPRAAHIATWCAARQ